MYRPAPKPEEAKALGLTWEEAGDGHVIEVWPDTQTAIFAFDALGTQWLRAGMTGLPTGINYGSVEPVLRLLKVSAEDWQDVFDDLRVMEEAALQEMQRQASTRK